MHGDFSRLDPIPANTYAVLQQQGKVITDWDLNASELNHRRIGTITRRDVIGRCGVPEGDRGGFAVGPNQAGDTLEISQGRIYVDGILCENPELVRITEQPNLPGFILADEAPVDGFYLAYLRVWQRHITALEDPTIREVALGGPDTTTRLCTVAQVLLAPIAVERDAPPPTCAQFDTWQPAVPLVLSALRARTSITPQPDRPCIVPAQAGYTGLENQLNRVEIHTGSDAQGGPTLKWSRDNGSVMAALIAIDGRRLTISDGGHDSARAFASGHMIEIRDERRVLWREPGVLATLESVAGDVLTVVEWPGGEPPQIGPGAFVQRWDSPEAILIEDQETWVDLEDGIQVQLSGDFRTGDYWTFPARTLTGEISWPVDDDGEPQALARQGIEYHFCALAVLHQEGGLWEQISDCRRFFFPLAERPGLHVISVERLETGALVRNDSTLSAATLVRGLRLRLDGSVDPGTIGPATVGVTVHLPYPLTDSEGRLWRDEEDQPLSLSFQPFILGYQPLSLDAVVRADGASITWLPTPAVGLWLQASLFRTLGQSGIDQRLRCEIVVRGNYVWAADDPQQFLDGDTFGRRTADGVLTDVRLPSGDGRRGGEFVFWFWLIPSGTPDDLTGRVNLNSASLESLIALPRIGHTLARRIITAREAQPFTTVDELVERVPGFTRSLLEELREMLRV